MKCIFAACIILATACSFGEGTPVNAQDRGQIRLMRTGGMVTRPGKGYVAIVNAQKKMTAADINMSIANIKKECPVGFRVVVPTDQINDAQVTVRLIDDPTKPVLVAAPETGWAEFNVARIADDLKSDDAKARFSPARMRKELMRAVAYAVGAGGSSFPGNIMDVTFVRELDFREEFIPADTGAMMLKSLKERGVLPELTTSYASACRGGWAPAPTNDIQKAIWEKIHTLPSKPLKIEKK